MARGKVTVFGGTGFLGRRVVRRLLDSGFSVRVASRHPEGTAAIFPDVRLRIEPIHADINDDRSVAAAVVDVEDVAEAIARAMQSNQSRMCYELGGPRVYTYRSLLEVIARHLGKKPLLVSMPFALWHALAYVAEMLPQPTITRNQVELMQIDSVASPATRGFDDLRISSTSLEDVLAEIVG
jgi:uncharacterized protein YbjT (DUF2867 family)